MRAPKDPWIRERDLTHPLDLDACYGRLLQLLVVRAEVEEIGWRAGLLLSPPLAGMLLACSRVWRRV